MGTFDISRINFDPKKHYQSVRMQQGRVLTDDDWNENERIANEDLRRSLNDTIGPYGTSDTGFKIANVKNNESGYMDFRILQGSIYLGGQRFELEQREQYRAQKDWLQQPADSDKIPQVTAGSEQYDLVYLEAWQQPVSAVEDSSLFETALGGPDTTTRVRKMRRVKVASDVGSEECSEAWNKLTDDWKKNNLGLINGEYERVPDTKLSVSFIRDGVSDDLCTPATAGGYLGAENQAIRVQIVDDSSGGKKITWGFDNASPLYRVKVDFTNLTVTILTEPKDQYHWPLSGQVVEILPWSAVLPNDEKIAEISGHLYKVNSSYDPDSGQLTLLDQSPILLKLNKVDRNNFSEITYITDQTLPDYYYMRVWNRGTDLASSPSIDVTTETPIPLGNTGLQVTFTGADWVPGDFWVIAARPETPNQVVPWEFEKGITHHGIRRFFAPLAVIKWTNGGENTTIGEVVHDCRRKFHPLTDRDGCCSFTVGNGITSNGDFNTIQEAVDNLPDKGGKICVLPGVHLASVTILNKQHIRISGCGDQTIVTPDYRRKVLATESVFVISGSQNIQIDQLTIVSWKGTGIVVQDEESSLLPSAEITICDNTIQSGIHAIYVEVQEVKGDNLIRILNNRIGIVDTVQGKSAIFSLADAVLIERNRIMVIPDNDGLDPYDPRTPGVLTPLEPCLRLDQIYTTKYMFRQRVDSMLSYVTLYRSFGTNLRKYNALGGIEIGQTSERVTIRQNEITGGCGNGITLCQFSDTALQNEDIIHSYPVYEITIEENTIQQMGLSGISTLLTYKEIAVYTQVKDLTVFRNSIRFCANLPQTSDGTKRQSLFSAIGGIVITDCTGGKIQENRIEENGRSSKEPVCGIFFYYGEKLNISGNSILNNGMPVTSDKSNVYPGNRGGIVVKMCFKPVNTDAQTGTFLAVENGWTKSSGNTETIAVIPSFDSLPAVVVHDNTVLQPLGFALFLSAFGPVSVQGNQFTSLGTDKTDQLSVLASAVFILNLGVSKDLFLLAFRNMTKNQNTYAKLLTNPAMQKFFLALEYLPSGRVMFSGNQTTLDMRYPSINLCLSSQFIASLDDIAFNNNQSECTSLLMVNDKVTTFDIVLLNTALIAVSVRSNNNRFTDGLTMYTRYSLLSYGFMNTAMGNQATHCILVMGNKKVKHSNIVLIDTNCPQSQLIIGHVLNNNAK